MPTLFSTDTAVEWQSTGEQKAGTRCLALSLSETVSNGMPFCLSVTGRDQRLARIRFLLLLHHQILVYLVFSELFVSMGERTRPEIVKVWLSIEGASKFRITRTYYCQAIVTSSSISRPYRGLLKAKSYLWIAYRRRANPLFKGFVDRTSAVLI